MSAYHRIKLLSVLLCGTLLLAACAKDPKDPAQGTGTLPPEGEHQENTERLPEEETVEPILKNFFSLTNVSPWRQLKGATRLDGECISRSEDAKLLVFRKRTLDHMNQVTETVTVYNSMRGETVLSLDNTYTHGEYANFDWENPKLSNMELSFPERLLEVAVKTVYGENGEAILSYIEARRAEITPVDGATFAANGGNSHTVSTNYTYYDAAGRKLAESKVKCDSERVKGEGIILRFDDATASFDQETMEAVSVTGSENEVVRGDFTYENQTYGYYMNQEQSGLLGDTVPFFEVYRKEDRERVLRYYPEEGTGSCRAFVLNSGDVFLQRVTEIDRNSGMTYDTVVDGHLLQIDSYLVTVPDGKTVEVACDYLITELYPRDAFLNTFRLEERGMMATENVKNVAMGIDFGEGRVDTNEGNELLVLDDQLNVMFVMDRIVPEHSFAVDGEDPFGFTLLSGGDYLVTLNGLTASRAIVSADGTVRSYLPEEARVVGEFVVMNDGLYDYDLNRLYAFSQNRFHLAFTIGDRIVVYRTVANAEMDEPGVEYFNLFRQGEGFAVLPFCEGEWIAVGAEPQTKDYVIVRNTKTEEYSLYNAKLEHILTTEGKMTVFLCGDRYVVYTQETTEDGVKDVFYAIES